MKFLKLLLIPLTLSMQLKAADAVVKPPLPPRPAVNNVAQTPLPAPLNNAENNLPPKPTRVKPDKPTSLPAPSPLTPKIENRLNTSQTSTENNTAKTPLRTKENTTFEERNKRAPETHMEKMFGVAQARSKEDLNRMKEEDLKRNLNNADKEVEAQKRIAQREADRKVINQAIDEKKKQEAPIKKTKKRGIKRLKRKTKKAAAKTTQEKKPKKTGFMLQKIKDLKAAQEMKKKEKNFKLSAPITVERKGKAPLGKMTDVKPWTAPKSTPPAKTGTMTKIKGMLPSRGGAHK